VNFFKERIKIAIHNATKSGHKQSLVRLQVAFAQITSARDKGESRWCKNIDNIVSQ